MEIKRILWPTDFSERSEKALPLITSLIEKYQTEIHVMYVVEDLSYYQTWLGGNAPNQVEAIMHKSKETANEKLGHSAIGSPTNARFPSSMSPWVTRRRRS